MAKKKEKPSIANEPISLYEKNRITFSTVETQNDVQLKYSIGISQVERLILMRKLNDYAFKTITDRMSSTKSKRLTFSSYEYIPE